MASPITVTLAGQKFGRLRSIASPYKTIQGLTVNTQCTCGTEKPILVKHLLSGAVRSCGCLARESGNLLRPTDAEGNVKYSATREYKAFSTAAQRCTNPNSKGYESCGGAGIQFYEPWIGDFPKFFKDLGPAGPGQILSRKNLKGNFDPENCYWATWKDVGQSCKQRRQTMKLAA